jgi:hypothetical protein
MYGIGRALAEKNETQEQKNGKTASSHAWPPFII